MKWYILVLKKYAVFSGRATRMEYWMFVLYSVIFLIVAGIVDFVAGWHISDEPQSNGILAFLYKLFVLVPICAVTVRRLHDIGKSGWVFGRYLLCQSAMFIIFLVYLNFAVVDKNLLESIRYGTFDPSIFSAPVATVALLIMAFLAIYCIWLFVFMCRDSQPRENKWGPNLKGERGVKN